MITTSFLKNNPDDHKLTHIWYMRIDDMDGTKLN